MIPRTACTLIVLTLLFIPISEATDREHIIAGMLSAVIPGAGQVYNVDYEKAGLFFIAWAGGIYAAVSSFEPNKAGTGVHIPHDKTIRFGGGLALWYGTALMSVLDAVIVRTEMNYREASIRSINEPDATGLRFEMRF